MIFFKYHIFLILLLSLFISCSKNSENDFKKLLNNEIKDFTYDSAKSFLEKNSKDLDTIVSTFLNQKSIKTIIRRNKTKSLYVDEDNIVKYSLICFNGEIFDFSFDAENLQDESDYWDKEFSIIKDDGKSNIKLEDFLLKNSIEKETVFDLLNFLSENNLSKITKSSKNSYVKINVELMQGLIYKDTNQNIYGEIDSDTELEKISESWFYFKEFY